MTPCVALAVADRQIFRVAVAAVGERLHVLQRGVGWGDMRAANPAGHLAVQLAGDGFVDFVAGVAESAHGSQFRVSKRIFCQPLCQAGRQ